MKATERRRLEIEAGRRCTAQLREAFGEEGFAAMKRAGEGMEAAKRERMARPHGPQVLAAFQALTCATSREEDALTDAALLLFDLAAEALEKNQPVTVRRTLEKIQLWGWHAIGSAAVTNDLHARAKEWGWCVCAAGGEVVTT